MKLLSMKLTNFKGIRDANFNFPDGGNYNIYGANEAGKSTTFDALTWLLFDKDSADTKDFSVKTIVDGEPLHHAEHSVECAFLLENGLRITLKKVFKERWQKPRGKLEAEFAGHTVNYFVDDVPKSASEYKKYVAGIIDEKKFKVLTIPTYFNEKLKDVERRELLVDIIGGIDQDVIIATNQKLKDLPKLLNGRSVEDYKLVLKQSLSKTKKEIDSIEPAIKENQSLMITGADAANMGMYQDARKRANDRIIRIMADIAKAQAGATNAELEAEISTVQNRIKALELDDLQQNREAEAKMNDAYRKSLQEMDVCQKELKLAELVQADLRTKINDCVKTRENLLQEFAKTKQTEFKEAEIKTQCPTCGQDLPEEKIEQAKAKQEEQRKQFMQNRAETLKSINVRGALNNEAKVEMEKKLEEVDAEIEIKKAAQQLAQSNVNAALYVQQHYQPAVNPEIKTQKEKLAALLQKRNTPDASAGERIAELEAKQKEAEADMANAQAKLNEIEQNRKHQTRIRELQEKEKELSGTFTELQRQLYLCDKYSRALTDYINDRIADKFKMARFVMFRDNISNDGVKECCDVEINGVPYHDLNHAKKINIGLDIIQTLCQYYGVTMPVFIDDADLVTNLLPTNLQIIRLVVSPADKILRVEKA